MKRIVSAVIASTALIGASTATAQTWSPGASPWVWSGTVIVQKGSGPPLPCSVNVEIDNPGSGSVTTGRLQIGPPVANCASIFIQSGPNHVVDYAVDGAGNETFTFRDVYVNTTITVGDCAGDLTVAFNDDNPPSAGDDSLDAATTLPAVIAGTGDCTINGNIQNVVPGGGSASIS